MPFIFTGKWSKPTCIFSKCLTAMCQRFSFWSPAYYVLFPFEKKNPGLWFLGSVLTLDWVTFLAPSSAALPWSLTSVSAFLGENPDAEREQQAAGGSGQQPEERRHCLLPHAAREFLWRRALPADHRTLLCWLVHSVHSCCTAGGSPVCDESSAPLLWACTATCSNSCCLTPCYVANCAYS